MTIRIAAAALALLVFAPDPASAAGATPLPAIPYSLFPIP